MGAKGESYGSDGEGGQEPQGGKEADCLGASTLGFSRVYLVSGVGATEVADKASVGYSAPSFKRALGFLRGE